MKRAVVAVILFACCSCSPAPTLPPPEMGKPAPPSAVVVEPEPEPEPRDEALMFVVRSFNQEPVPAYASMAADAPVAFEADHGSSGDVLSSATFEKDGKSLVYWEVTCESGRGWIWEGHLDVVPRPKTKARTAAVQAPPTGANAAEPARTITIVREHLPGTPGADSLSLATTSAAVPDVLTVNEPGQPVVIAEHLVQGQYTIIDIFSPRCGPCRRIGPQLERFAAAHPQVVLRKIDINRPTARGIDWGSPAAQQLGVGSVPQIDVYGPEGELVASGDYALTFLQELAQQ